MIAKKIIIPLYLIRATDEKLRVQLDTRRGVLLPETGTGNHMEEPLAEFRRDGYDGYVILLGELFEPLKEGEEKRRLA